MQSKFLVILLFHFCIQLAVADRHAIYRRDETTNLITSVTETSASAATKATQSTSNNGRDSTTQSASGTTAVSSTSTSIAASSTASVAIATSSVNSSVIYNSTILPGQLPITPEVTPGFAVAGVILMITGIAYTLIGIKNRLLHISLSAGYLASVSVTVLILYVMSPPISNAVQGAYVVAVVITGLIIGGAACVFTEITEGLGCLLGGFCFSMWLLVFKPGGLLTTTSGKSIFIAAFAAAAFTTSFSHYTRPYGLIGGVSFAGATVVVLGIDCFSRAGLKEFWAYVWDLNDNLFPVGTTTYPITRGIRVEIAAIFIGFLIGIVSQMKLWKVVKERREHRAAERLEDERSIAQEEESIGRRIEHQNAAERGQWENVYGDRGESKGAGSSRDSGIGSMERKGTASTTTTMCNSGEIEIEMAPMPSPAPGLVMADKGQGGSITVLVVRDPEPQPERDEAGNPIAPSQRRLSRDSAEDDVEKTCVVAANSETRFESKQAKESPISTVPEVIPLPFKVPDSVVEGECSNRSSVATFAEDDQRRLSKRLSAGTALLRRLSQRSKRDSKRFSRATMGSSTEDLVIPHTIDDDRSSIAATIDELSDNEDMTSQRTSIQGPVLDLGDKQASDTATEAETSHKEQSPASGVLTRSYSVATTAVTVATDIPNSDLPKEETLQIPNIPPSLTSSMDAKPEAAIQSPAIEETTLGKAEESTHGPAAEETKLDNVEESTQGPAAEETKLDNVEESTHGPAAEETKLDNVEESTQGPAAEETKLDNAEESTQGPVAEETEFDKAEESTQGPAAEETEFDKAEESTHGPASVASNHDANPVSISKDRLPPQLSKVVISYRTNEWAKHLSSAEAPALEELQLAQYPVESQTEEVAAPLNVQELQQTAESGTPAPAPRSITQNSSASLANARAPINLPPFTGTISHREFQQSTHVSQSLNTRGIYRSSSTPQVDNAIVNSPIKDNLPLTSSASSPNVTKHSPLVQSTPFGSTTLIGKRHNMLRDKSPYDSPVITPKSRSQESSEAGSLYRNPGILEDDNMSLSARRNLIRQSSLQATFEAHRQHSQSSIQQIPAAFDSHQPIRQSSLQHPLVREQQMVSWRASVQQDLRSSVQPKNAIERQQSQLWLERQAEEQVRAISEKNKRERDSMFDERMRRGDMLDAHREALRKMQRVANRAL